MINFPKFLCRIGVHDGERCGAFVFCRRPDYKRVEWCVPDSKHWELDICDTREVYEWKVVQE